MPHCSTKNKSCQKQTFRVLWNHLPSLQSWFEPIFST
uniref:Uncharacterized protein n=1 Tax=Anguilla anguilla TaxID=7936 RepID=A0A0E9T013_ANGAN